MRFLSKFVFAAALTMIGVAGPAQAQPALEFDPTSATQGYSTSDVTAGWSFTTNQAIVVDALGAFDVTGVSGSGRTPGAVRLYDSSQNLIASATVLATDPQEGSPTLFYSHAISPVTLAADTTYYIVEDLNGSDTVDGSTLIYFLTGALATDAGITYGVGVSDVVQGSLPTSDLAFGGGYDPAYFGPNFDIYTPEPLTLSLFGAGLVGAVALRRRKTAKVV